jgi:hypothetical protein
LEHVPACAAPMTCSVSRSPLATESESQPAPRGAGVYVAEGSVAAITPRIAFRAPAVIVSRCRSRVLHDGALRAEVDRPVIGRHGGLDGVAVVDIWDFGLP